MFSSEERIIFYLTGKFLKLLTVKTDSKLDFDPKIIQNQEIVNQDKFDEVLIEFLNKLSIKRAKVIIILAEGLVFEKSIKIDKKEEIESTVQKFLDEVPFDPGQIAKIEFYFNNTLNIIAVNKNLYLIIKNICENLGWEIEAVFPATIFEGLKTEEDLTPEKTKIIVNRVNSLKKANFLYSSEKSETNTKNGSSAKNRWYLVLIFLVLVLISGFTIFMFLKIAGISLPKFPLQNKVEKITITPTPIATIQESSGSSQLNSLKKEDLIIKILNGSGIVGQAKELKGQLGEAGFNSNNIETGNADEIKDTTIIQFKERVPKIFRQEILDTLNKTLKNTASEENEDLTEDVLITTGK